MAKFSITQIQQGDSLLGLAHDHHFGYSYMTEPQLASPIAAMLYAKQKGRIPLRAYLAQFGKTMKKDDSPIEQFLLYDGDANYPLIGARIGGVAITAASQCGLAGNEFELVFAKDFADVPDTIVGERNEQYPMRIQNKRQEGGDRVVYTVTLTTAYAVPGSFVPFDELIAGRRFSRDYAAVSSILSAKGGSFMRQTPSKIRNYFTMIRKEREEAGKNINRIIKFMVETEKGKSQNWMQYSSNEFNMQFEEEIDKALMFGRLTMTPDGQFKNYDKSSGFEIVEGAGLREQIGYFNNQHFPATGFNINDLYERLVELTLGKNVNGSSRILIRTGKGGKMLFDAGMRALMNTYPQARDNGSISGAGSNSMTFGGAFTQWRNTPGGIDIDVMHEPLYDVTDRNKILMPGFGTMPAESFRMDIATLGTDKGEANIKLYEVEDADVWGFIPGMRDPFTGAKNPKMMASRVDGWEEHRMWQGMVLVSDPTRCMVYKPDVL